MCCFRRATGRTRTDDPVITSDVLYQLSYGGDVFFARQAWCIAADRRDQWSRGESNP